MGISTSMSLALSISVLYISGMQSGNGVHFLNITFLHCSWLRLRLQYL